MIIYKYIKIILLLIIAIIAVLYWQTLLRIVGWLIILNCIIRFFLRVLGVLAPIVVPIAVLYLLFH